MSESDLVSAEKHGTPIARIAGLAEVGNPIDAAAGYRQAIRDAYWEDHDIGLVMAVAYAGLGRVLADAAASSDPQREYALRSEAKAICYDLASFTWLGWGEPGIVITADQARAGLEAAEANLRFAEQLDKGDLPLSRALWMLGAQLAAGGDHEAAGRRFVEAAGAARAAEADDEAALADAFAALTDVLAGDEAGIRLLDERLVALREFENGAGFAEQVTTARSVLDR